MNSRKQNRADGPERSGQTTLVNALLANSPTVPCPEAASYLLFAAL
jgi:hypothetical protein